MSFIHLYGREQGEVPRCDTGKMLRKVRSIMNRKDYLKIIWAAARFQEPKSRAT